MPRFFQFATFDLITSCEDPIHFVTRKSVSILVIRCKYFLKYEDVTWIYCTFFLVISPVVVCITCEYVQHITPHCFDFLLDCISLLWFSAQLQILNHCPLNIVKLKILFCVMVPFVYSIIMVTPTRSLFSSSSFLMASCKCLGMILVFLLSQAAFPANSRISAARYRKFTRPLRSPGGVDTSPER